MKAPGRLEDLVQVMGILEIRYPRAHAYWDKSGSLAATIEGATPSLTCQQLGPRGFEFSGAQGCGIQVASFFWDRVILNEETGASIGQFESLALSFWSHVADAFRLGELTRVGNRYRYLFPTDSPSAAADLLSGCGAIWSLGEGLGAFGIPDTEGTVLRTSLLDQNRRIRLETSTGDLSVQGKTRCGVSLDIDFSLAQAPAGGELDLRSFLLWNQRFLRDNLHTVLRHRR